MSATTTTMNRNQMYSRVSKVDRLNARVSKLLTAAVDEVLDLVRETVSEYHEKTARTQRENERLRQRLRDALGSLESERAAARHAQLASVLECAIIQEQEQQEQHQQQVCDAVRTSTVRQEPECPPDAAEIPAGGDDISEQTGGEPEEEQKLTAEALTECALRVRLLFTDHDRTLTSEGAPPADETVKLHAVESIKSDADPMPVSPVTMTTTMPCIPSPSNQASSDIYTIAPELIKTEPPSPKSSTSQQEAPLSSFCFTDDLSPVRPQPPPAAASRTLSSTAGPYGLLFVPPTSREQSHSHPHPQPPSHSLGRRLGLGLGFGRVPRLSNNNNNRRHRPGALRHDDPHVCGVCGKTFSRLGNLRIHERCHTGEKPYACGQCGRCFSQAGDLKKHRRVHTGEKPYYCGQCGKSFSRGENLRRHQKIHVGERGHLQQAWADLRPQC